MINTYLALAYGFLWCIFVVYAGTIHRRQERLEKELEELRSVAHGQDASGSGHS
jgi:CcmD family protein